MGADTSIRMNATYKLREDAPPFDAGPLPRVAVVTVLPPGKVEFYDAAHRSSEWNLTRDDFRKAYDEA